MIATTCCFVWCWLCHTPSALTRSFSHCLWARLCDLCFKNILRYSYYEKCHIFRRKRTCRCTNWGKTGKWCKIGDIWKQICDLTCTINILFPYHQHKMKHYCCVCIHTRQMWVLNCRMQFMKQDWILSSAALIWCMLEKWTPLTLCVALKRGFPLVDMWTVTIRRISWPKIPC